MQTVAETSRLLFRRFTIADAPFIRELNSDPEVIRYVHELPLESIADAEKVITERILPQYELYGFGRWAIIDKASGELTGWCGLKYRPERNEHDLGYRFLRKYWGRGYATEAATISLDMGFGQFGLQRIIGRAHVENKASLHVLKKLGMQFLCYEEVDQCPVETYVIESTFAKI